MRSRVWLALAFLLPVTALCPIAGTAIAQPEDAPTVNYVSADAVYLSVGRRAGLTVGARVEVVRDSRTIAVLEVVHVSSHSASCRVVEQIEPPRVGDTAVFDPLAAPPPIQSTARLDTARASPDYAEKRTTNIVSGYVELQNVWQQDLTGSNLSLSVRT